MSEKIYGSDDNKNLVPVYSKEEVDRNIGHLKSKDFISTPLIASTYLSNNTGKLIIKLPHRKDSLKHPMIKLTIELINKYGNDYAEYVVSAQLFKGAWTSIRTTISNGRGTLSNAPISLGVEDEYYAITIGEDTTVWSYLQVNIKDVSVWYYTPKFEDWDNNWDISIGIPTGTYTLTTETPNQLLNTNAEVEKLKNRVTPINLGGTGANNTKTAMNNLMANAIIDYSDQIQLVGNVKSYSVTAFKMGRLVFISGQFNFNSGEMPIKKATNIFKLPSAIIPDYYVPMGTLAMIATDQATAQVIVSNIGNVSFYKAGEKTSTATVYFSGMYMLGTGYD